MPAELTPSADASALQVHISATLSAAEVEALIRQLAIARAALLPAVPAQDTHTPQGGQSRLIEDATAMAIERPQADGQIVWNLRSEGLGWLGWRLHPDHIVGWVKYLAAYGYLQMPDTRDQNNGQRH